jgi:hypothetical protein
MRRTRSVKTREIGTLLATALFRQLGAPLSMTERGAIQDLAQRTASAVSARHAGPMGARELAVALIAELLSDPRERVH